LQRYFLSGKTLKESGPEERRKEQRYPVPAIYQKYITIEAYGNDICLIDFSRSGLGFVSLKELKVGTCIDCVLSAPRSLSQKVRLTVEVRFCKEISDEYVIGSLIKKVEDELWFDLFQEVHDYILKHGDEFY